MTKEQAVALYNELQASMNKMVENTRDYKPGNELALSRQDTQSKSKSGRFSRVFFSSNKEVALAVVIAALLFSKVLLFSSAIASSKEIELKARWQIDLLNRFAEWGNVPAAEDLLRALENKRLALANKEEKLFERERYLNNLESLITEKSVQLRSLADEIFVVREKLERKKSDDYAQVAMVYASMNPIEAAKLVSQLEIHIAIEILDHMPDKKMAQIISVMDSERALELTRRFANRF